MVAVPTFNERLARRLRWLGSLFLVVAAAQSTLGRVEASCGDYVHIGNPRIAMGDHASSPEAPGEMGERSLPGDSRIPCNGVNCRRNSQDSEAPAPKMAPVDRGEALLVGLQSFVEGTQGRFQSSVSGRLVSIHLSSGLYRPPRGV